MSLQEETANGKTALSSKQQAVLEKLLKGKVSTNLTAPKIPKREVYSPVILSFAPKRTQVKSLKVSRAKRKTVQLSRTTDSANGLRG